MLLKFFRSVCSDVLLRRGWFDDFKPLTVNTYNNTSAKSSREQSLTLRLIKKLNCISPGTIIHQEVTDSVHRTWTENP